MNTLIFKSYYDFLNRENKDFNGVSEQFAKDNPNFIENNESNKACWNCSGCSYCSGCSGCSDCRSCSYCSGCSDCRYCCGCSGCSGCSYCRSCSEFTSNPERIVSPVIGRRKDKTTYYWTSGREQVVCGCFKGTLEEFKNAVAKTHGNNEHAKNYTAWISAVETYKSLLA